MNKKTKNSIYHLPFTNHGFTMIEILTVAAIIVLLAAILLPAVGKARERAYIAKGKAAIAALETAISMYESDFGYYPGVDKDTVGAGTDTGMGNMMVNILSSYTLYNDYPKWQGPYLEFKSTDISGTYGGGDQSMLDPWGVEYHYQINGPNISPRVRIWSNGPDGSSTSLDQSTPQDDDIGNW